VKASVTVDTAMCPDCRAELFSQDNRRRGHAFINCTNCGPRFSIVREIPYDRGNTTMSGFRMCARCAHEYDDPRDRRFHAQPICCRDCGPVLELIDHGGKPVSGEPVSRAAGLLLEGRIVAIKGIGGFHLAVRADCHEAVSRLRTLKQRDSKPFALMVPDIDAARRFVDLSTEAEAELASPAAPIVLSRGTTRAELDLSPAVAPGTHLLGLMLPYAPLHHLLFKALADAVRPLAAPPLVMTSGNLSDEPLVIDNTDARVRLGPLCDAILMHDRPIERSVDDSVLRDRGEGFAPLPIRRSRGYVPAGWAMPPESGGHATGICLGGELKNTVALVRERDVIVSQHLGDLTHPLAFQHFQKAIADFSRLFAARIRFVAHDLHPNYMSTHYGQQLAREAGAVLIPVQHHVAHAHAVLAEHRIETPALALVCDGAGYGTDGTTWGGELLYIDGGDWKRLASLRPMRLPGGDAAAADTRRSALALLHMAYGDSFERLPLVGRLFPDREERGVLARMIRTGIQSPWTTSAGRLFDGVAALLGVCLRNGHEAQAAMALEAAAQEKDSGGAFAGDDRGSEWFSIERTPGGLWQLDLAPFIRHIVEAIGPGGRRIAELASGFHATLADGFTALTLAVNQPHLPMVLGGGTFCNQLLCKGLLDRAATFGRKVFLPGIYPPTDAGLSFGQAAFVLRQSRSGEEL
jgi:hydrogenase maturation protein HypF